MPTKKHVTPKQPSKPAEPAHFTTTSSKAAYEHCLPLASAVPTEGLDVCKVDVEIARVNIERGVDAVRPHLATLAKKLPECPLEAVLELPVLGLALLFAVGKIVKSASSGEIASRLATMRRVREASLLQLEVFALLGDIPAEVVARIRKGSGPLDAARDAVAIPGVFHDYAAKIDGKHPFTPPMLANLGADGDWLLTQLNPTGARPGVLERDPAAIVRDQIWAIINDRHEHLRQAGAVVFGMKSLDEHVPPLGARVMVTRAGGATPPASGGQAEAAVKAPVKEGSE